MSAAQSPPPTDHAGNRAGNDAELDVDNDRRLDLLRRWLAGLQTRTSRSSSATPEVLGLQLHTLRPASSDASFRRYFRIDCAAPTRSVIAMDAPPKHEDCDRFVAVAALLRGAAVNTPRILAADQVQGFMLLTDLGSTTYLDALDGGCAAEPLYADALAALLRIQRAARPAFLPEYDRDRLDAELRLFPQWFVTRHCRQALSSAELQALETVYAQLLERALAQPRVIVHRDFHVRNLMHVAPLAKATAGALPGEPDHHDNPGVLDFQDAVYGPITYDLVSLLRDAYVAWDEARQLDWAIRYWEQARAAGLPVAGESGDFAAFWQDFEWMGLQRHLKILGIFARLHHRDGKPRYLADLPRVFDYALLTARRYAALTPLARLLERLAASLPRAACST